MRQTSRAVTLLLTLESARVADNTANTIIEGFLDAITQLNFVIITDNSAIANNRMAPYTGANLVTGVS